jgi:hypothetical protein
MLIILGLMNFSNAYTQNIEFDTINYDYHFLQAGLIFPSNANFEVSKKWRVGYKHIADCGADKETLILLHAHNDSVEKLVNQKYGVNWEKEFNSQVAAELANETKARELLINRVVSPSTDTTEYYSSLSFRYSIETIKFGEIYNIKVSTKDVWKGKYQEVDYFVAIVNIKNSNIEMISQNFNLRYE